jgi:hypothetical protein
MRQKGCRSLRPQPSCRPKRMCLSVYQLIIAHLNKIYSEESARVVARLHLIQDKIGGRRHSARRFTEGGFTNMRKSESLRFPLQDANNEAI